MFGTRNLSLKWLNNELLNEANCIEQGFVLIDLCIERLNNINQQEKESEMGVFSRVYNLNLAKARNLLVGCFCLALDALSQESGALFRPLIETYELMVYFRKNPSKMADAAVGNKPSPGKIAQIIDGDFQDLRNYLNQHSSHITFSLESLDHLVDYQTGKVKKNQTQSIEVLKKSLIIINSFQVFILSETFQALSEIWNISDMQTDIATKWLSKSKSEN